MFSEHTQSETLWEEESTGPTKEHGPEAVSSKRRLYATEETYSWGHKWAHRV